MAAAPVELWSTRLSCPQLHRRISSLPQQLPSATLGEPENPSLNSDPGCIKVVDTYRFVISRSTAFTYRDRQVPIRQIGKELNVRYALEGSVLADPTRVRVNVQLIDAQTE